MNINLHTWFAQRRVEFLPKHFVATKTPLDDAKHIWILEKCVGRYYVGKNKEDDDDWLSLFNEERAYFEDPQEAVLYELTWS